MKKLCIGVRSCGDVDVAVAQMLVLSCLVGVGGEFRPVLVCMKLAMTQDHVMRGA
jgi:hypothetical protein